MLDLFLKFISDIALKVFEKYSPEKDPTKKGLRRLFVFYHQLCHLHEYLRQFAMGLERWEASQYDGNEWAMCQRCISQLVHVLAILEDDLSVAIALIDFEVAVKIKGFLGSKRTVFSVWRDLMSTNAEERFCGWYSDRSGNTWKKTIYIPNYSLLLTDVPATLDLPQLETSCWADEFHWAKRKNLDPRSLQFLPELPDVQQLPAAPYIRIKHYCKAIQLPEQQAELNDIIVTTRQRVEELGELLKRLGSVLNSLAGGNPAVFLEFL